MHIEIEVWIYLYETATQGKIYHLCVKEWYE